MTIESLIDGLRHPAPPARWAAVRALWDLGPAAAPAAVPLVEMLREADKDLCDLIGSTLARIGGPAVPALVRALADENRYVRREAANALAVVGPAAREAVPALVEALRHRDPVIRLVIAGALARVGPQAADALPGLVALLRDDDDEGVRAAAAAALGTLGAGNADVIRALRDALGDSDVLVREAAVLALRRLGSPA